MLLDDATPKRLPPPARATTPLAHSDGGLLSEALHVLRRRLGWLFFAGWLGIPLALVASGLFTPRYNAHAELLVDPRDLRIFENEVAPNSPTADNGAALVESQARVLASDNVLRLVIAKLSLTSDPEFNGTGHAGFASVSSILNSIVSSKTAAGDPTETALQTLARQTAVRRPERTDVLEITAGADSREKAVSITQAMIDAYLADLASARNKSIADARASIDSRLEALRQNVTQSEAKIAKYKAENNLLTSGGLLVIEQQLNEVNNQLVQARAETSRAKARYQEMQATFADPGSSPEAVNSATLRNLKAQLSAISAQRQQLGAGLLPGHPAMQAITAEERTVRNQMSVEMRHLLEASRHEYERAKVSEEALAATLQDLRKQQIVSNDAQVPLRELQREFDANQSIYQAAILRVREAKEQEGINTANVRVISPAIADRDAAFPPSKRLLVPLGFVTTFWLAWLAFLVARGWRHHSKGSHPASA